jgi:hypothetical protein
MCGSKAWQQHKRAARRSKRHRMGFVWQGFVWGSCRREQQVTMFTQVQLEALTCSSSSSWQPQDFGSALNHRQMVWTVGPNPKSKSHLGQREPASSMQG